MIINPTYFIDVISLCKVYHLRDSIQIEVHGNYIKQTYRNRCYIAAANGRLSLNIPIIHTGKGTSIKYSQVLIDHSDPWASNHLKSIKSAYNSSPFFEYYEDDLVELFSDIPDLLMDWNLKTFQFILDQMQINIGEVKPTTTFLNDLASTKLAEAKTAPLIDLPSYIQVFQEKHGFIAPLSSLDLLFNLGPAAVSYLSKIDRAIFSNTSMTSPESSFNDFYRSCSLWRGELAGMKQFHLDSIRIDQFGNSEMNLAISQIPQRTVLGKRAEYYFKFLVEHSTNYQLLLSNVQVFKGKVTTGELDFIIREKKSSTIFHVELVFKFYIYDPDVPPSEKWMDNPCTENELARYVGPNRRDNLLKKLKKLKSHQLPLLYTAETQLALKDLKINSNSIEQRVCFLARIFIPQTYWSHDFKYINKQCIVGYYVNYEAFAKAETQNTYILPPKSEWINAPYLIKEKQYIFKELVPLLKERIADGYASLLWMQIETGGWEQFFVVK